MAAYHGTALSKVLTLICFWYDAMSGADDEQSKEAGSEYLHVVEKRMMLNLAEWIICFQDALLGGEGQHTWSGVCKEREERSMSHV